MTTPFNYRAVGIRMTTRNRKKYFPNAGAALAATAGNNLFVSLAALIATAKADLEAATTAQTDCAPPNKCTTTVNVFKNALNTSELSMGVLLNGVQGIADASPDGAAVLTSAGFQVKKRAVRSKAASRLADGANEGEMLATVKSPGRSAARTIEIAVSADGGKTWPYDWVGPDLSHLFTGLAAGVVHSVRYRVKLLRKEYSAWSDPITMMVK